jgi:hypothetical protein
LGACSRQTQQVHGQLFAAEDLWPAGSRKEPAVGQDFVTLPSSLVEGLVLVGPPSSPARGTRLSREKR